MDDIQLGELKFGTKRALEDYIAELHRSNENLDRIVEPSSELSSILDEQDHAERQALTRYQDAKQRLFRALRT